MPKKKQHKRVFSHLLDPAVQAKAAKARKKAFAAKRAAKKAQDSRGKPLRGLQGIKRDHLRRGVYHRVVRTHQLPGDDLTPETKLLIKAAKLGTNGRIKLATARLLLGQVVELLSDIR